MQPEIQSSWNKTCKLLFGEEIGLIEDYEEWLKGLIAPNMAKKSAVSGKDVSIAVREYAEGSKFISFDEIEFDKKFDALNIDEVKDIDSIITALSDRFLYSGNVLLGHSLSAERSTNVSDCSYVYETAQFDKSKFMAYCTVGRESNNLFGVYGPGETEYCIRCTQTYRDRRCFELWMSQNCSDCYYSYNLDGCSNCIFCFNLRNKKNCIGNLELSPQKFAEIKSRLVSQMREQLKKDKRLPSLLQIVRRGKFLKPPKVGVEEDNERYNSRIMEESFSSVTNLLFGKSLKGIDKYADWLYLHAHKIAEVKSAVSGKEIRMNSYVIAGEEIPKDRIVDISEALALGKELKITEEEAEQLSFEGAPSVISKLAFFNVEFNEGKNSNLLDCTMSIESTDCYRASATVHSKLCGCGMWPTRCENCFGFDTIKDVMYSINCYHSVKLTRCFEMDNCRDCADSMFCHNCEALSNCMFCFNIKSKRYAIGNVEVGREPFMRIKKMVLDELVSKLERDKKFDVSIYNLGFGKR